MFGTEGTPVDKGSRMKSYVIPIVFVSCLATGLAAAQDRLVIDVGRNAVLIHGNYCGPGNRSPLPPVDTLDQACQHHDACSPPRGKIASCSCNDRLNREAALVADDPGEPQDVRDTAEFIAATALALPCR